MQQTSEIRKGVLFGLISIMIWGSWPVVTALGMKQGMTPYELLLLRFSVASVILLPFAFRGNNSLKEWVTSLLFACTAGVTYSVASINGFTYAPANHGGVIIPGTVMLFTLTVSHFWLKERLTKQRVLGAAIIAAGLLCLSIGASTGAAHKANSWIGDCLFVLAGLLWGTYTTLIKRWPMPPLTVAARIAFVSCALMGTYHVFWGPETHFLAMPVETIALQVLWQGVFSAVVAIIFFNKAVAILGSGRTSVLNASVPAIVVVLAVIILGEIPNQIEQLGLLAIISGIVIAIMAKTAPLAPPVKECPKPL
ncbi:DMT family transporter [Kordiimonas pumila]|uniref:DMT family transporter n=1 Tax=Kordiimonas pumila TaxID=2161677 RepID=A0ABV7D078_9PROT|nr:DMT family transporter [Kordiimonas pumila]